MFLLIIDAIFFSRLANVISIHLMFLLISKNKKADKERTKISIHLMFLLISINSQALRPIGYFNTSHVSINLNIRLRAVIYTRFQYISCFY